MVTRIRLFANWPLWQTTKELYTAAMLRITKELRGADVKGVKLVNSSTHDEFAGHLLDVHQQWCRPCKEESRSSPGGDADSTCPQPRKITTATQTTGLELDRLDVFTTSRPSTSRHGSAPDEIPAAQTPKKDESSGIPWNASTPESRQTGRVELISPIHPTVVLNEVRAKEGLPPLPSDDSDSSDEEEDDPFPLHVYEDDPIHASKELPSSHENLHNMSIDEMVFQVEEDGGQERQEDEEDEGEEEQEVQEEEQEEEQEGEHGHDEIEQIIKGKKCIVYLSKLIDLLILVHGTVCRRNRCGRDVSYTTRWQGTALIVKWACSADHVGGTWSSQPKFKGLYAGNLELASALIMSGNNFTKTSLLARFCGLQFMSATSFYRYQRLFVAPAVDKYWIGMQSDQLQQVRDKQIILAGDGRNDSPGHSSQYCTYSFADAATGQIMHVEVVDVREAAGKSTNMERIAFERGMAFLMNRVNVQSVVTDAHPQIMALMKRCDKYSGIGHQIDVWHGGKNLTKKLTKVAAEKSCRVLQPWIPAIRNHFWYVAKSCDHDANRLVISLFGILHHICNEHEWGLCADGSVGKCDHDSLPVAGEDKQWLEKDSPPHRALERILSDTRFKNTLPYYKDFLHTGKLESFHSHLLMYCSKLHSYRYRGYILRNQLAVIDHNKHLNRPVATNKDGKVIKARAFNRRTKRYVVTDVPVCKQYSYIHDIMKMIFSERVARPGPLNVVLPLAAEDPRRIFPNRYMVPAPPIAQLVEQHISRFK